MAGFRSQSSSFEPITYGWLIADRVHDDYGFGSHLHTRVPREKNRSDGRVEVRVVPNVNCRVQAKSCFQVDQAGFDARR